MKLPAYLQSLMTDPLFLRVCMVLWGLPFVALGTFAGIEWKPETVWEMMGFALVVLIGLYGAYLLYTATFGNRRQVAQSADLLSDGGDLLGVIFLRFWLRG